MSHIVVGTCLTDASRPAFDAAIAMARDTGIGLTLVHGLAYSPNIGIAGGAVQRDIQQVREEHGMDLALQLSEEWLALARAEGIEADGRITQGDPVDLILSVAAAVDAPFIVVGSHHRKGLARFILGSVSESVVRRSKVPVLVVPTHH